MIKIEFSKLKQVISKTPRHFYVEVHWTLDGAIIMSALWIYGRRTNGRTHQT